MGTFLRESVCEVTCGELVAEGRERTKKEARMKAAVNMILQAEMFEGEPSFKGSSSSVRSQHSSKRRSGSSSRRVEDRMDKTGQNMDKKGQNVNTGSKHNDKLEGATQERYHRSRSDSRDLQESESSQPSKQHIVEHGNETNYMDHEVFYADDISEQEPKKDIIRELEYLRKLGDYLKEKEEKEMRDNNKQRISENENETENDKHGQTALVETLNVDSDSEEIKLESDEDIPEENYNVDMNISIPSSPPGRSKSP